MLDKFPIEIFQYLIKQTYLSFGSICRLRRVNKRLSLILSNITVEIKCNFDDIMYGSISGYGSIGGYGSISGHGSIGGHGSISEYQQSSSHNRLSSHNHLSSYNGAPERYQSPGRSQSSTYIQPPGRHHVSTRIQLPTHIQSPRYNQSPGRNQSSSFDQLPSPNQSSSSDQPLVRSQSFSSDQPLVRSQSFFSDRLSHHGQSSPHGQSPSYSRSSSFDQSPSYTQLLNNNSRVENHLEKYIHQIESRLSQIRHPLSPKSRIKMISLPDIKALIPFPHVKNSNVPIFLDLNSVKNVGQELSKLPSGLVFLLEDKSFRTMGFETDIFSTIPEVPVEIETFYYQNHEVITTKNFSFVPFPYLYLYCMILCCDVIVQNQVIKNKLTYSRRNINPRTELSTIVNYLLGKNM